MKTNPNDLITTMRPEQGQHGLTKREHFAALAMHGLVANDTLGGDTYESIAEMAIKHADALIKALNAAK